MIKMGVIRTTITIDEIVAQRIRKIFNGNSSAGINQMLEEHLKEKEQNPIAETFGTFKFKGSTDQLLKETDKELWGED